MSFIEEFDPSTWGSLKTRVYEKKASDVERAFSRAGKATLDDFLALISPAAEPFLEQMAKLSRALTLKRFGKTIQMYIPLYLSNECTNVCTYCGFSFGNKLPRLTLNDEQILKEAEAIKKLGYEHVLLVSGEARAKVNVDYFAHAISLLKPHFANISLEVQPLSTEEYAKLISLGLYAVLVYQETYDREAYANVHLKGKKSNFEYRLETPERLGQAGIHKIGLGALFGLSDWRIDSASVAMHLLYLRKKFWKTKFSISFPRLRPAVGLALAENCMSERQLVQAFCAFRLLDENVELSLSTRERAQFRDKVIQLGVTSLSAGSKTDPGGYALGTEALEQFEVSDERSPAEVVQMIRAQGYEAVWKDWEHVYTDTSLSEDAR